MFGETDFSGRHVLVCGASSGIGRAAALLFAGERARIAVLARRREMLESLCAELRERGAPGAEALAVDVEDEGTLRAAVSGLLAASGPVHVLVVNSGGPPAGHLLDATRADLECAFSRHVLAAHTLVSLVLPGMREAGYGRIVNVVSTSVREPIPSLGVSNTVRAAMAGFAKTLSRELPPGITINNVLPGYTATERLRELADAVASRTGRAREEVENGWLADIPEGRLAEPEEIAAMIVFLASPRAAYVRGQSIAVDGGRLRSI